jgi:hypothetical protein
VPTQLCGLQQGEPLPGTLPQSTQTLLQRPEQRRNLRQFHGEIALRRAPRGRNKRLAPIRAEQGRRQGIPVEILRWPGKEPQLFFGVWVRLNGPAPVGFCHEVLGGGI